jgi:hypothetical protein
MTTLTILESLKAEASEQMALFPQYQGHFDNYELVEITQDVRTKMGLAFVKGEIAIAGPRTDRIFPSYYRTVWSMRNKVDTSIPMSAIGKA